MASKLITLTAALLLGVSAAFAQPTGEAPKIEAQSAPECARVQRHDHSAERGFPGAKAPCKPAKSDSARPKAKVEGHDHGKMHKGQ